MTLSINDTQHNNVKCHYTLSIVMLSVLMVNRVMLSVVILNVVMLSVLPRIGRLESPLLFTP